MVMAWILFSGVISLTLDRQDMDQNRPLQIEGVVKGPDKTVEPMPLDRTDVFEFKGLKEHPWSKKGDEGIHTLSDNTEDVITNAGYGF